jgi:transposase
MTTNKRYSKEYKKQILERLQPPHNKSVAQVAKEEDINRNTLYAWIYSAREKGLSIPNSSPSHQVKWRKEDKLKMVLETFAMNENELSSYCRERGLYASEIKEWLTVLEESLDHKAESAELSAERQKNKQLEKDLRRKEKALAETAALLVLRKKVDAIWGDPEED